VTANSRKDSGEQAMKIMDMLNIEGINVDLKARDKKGILDELVAPVAEKTGTSHEKLVKVLQERERLGSTGIGGGIGIPHGKLKNLDTLILGFGLSRQGVDFESMDSRPTHIFFLLLTPESSAGVHLKLLARISRLLKDDALKKRLMQAKAPEDVIAVIQEEDEDF
jgi:nitrogen PTS system EIIA component